MSSLIRGKKIENPELTELSHKEHVARWKGRKLEILKRSALSKPIRATGKLLKKAIPSFISSLPKNYGDTVIEKLFRKDVQEEGSPISLKVISFIRSYNPLKFDETFNLHKGDDSQLSTTTAIASFQGLIALDRRDGKQYSTCIKAANIIITTEEFDDDATHLEAAIFIFNVDRNLDAAKIIVQKGTDDTKTLLKAAMAVFNDDDNLDAAKIIVQKGTDDTETLLGAAILVFNDDDGNLDAAKIIVQNGTGDTEVLLKSAMAVFNDDNSYLEAAKIIVKNGADDTEALLNAAIIVFNNDNSNLDAAKIIVQNGTDDTKALLNAAIVVFNEDNSNLEAAKIIVQKGSDDTEALLKAAILVFNNDGNLEAAKIIVKNGTDDTKTLLKAAILVFNDDNSNLEAAIIVFNGDNSNLEAAKVIVQKGTDDIEALLNAAIIIFNNDNNDLEAAKVLVNKLKIIFPSEHEARIEELLVNAAIIIFNEQPFDENTTLQAAKILLLTKRKIAPEEFNRIEAAKTVFQKGDGDKEAKLQASIIIVKNPEDPDVEKLLHEATEIIFREENPDIKSGDTIRRFRAREIEGAKIHAAKNILENSQDNKYETLLEAAKIFYSEYCIKHHTDKTINKEILVKAAEIIFKEGKTDQDNKLQAAEIIFENIQESKSGTCRDVAVFIVNMAKDFPVAYSTHLKAAEFILTEKAADKYQTLLNAAKIVVENNKGATTEALQYASIIFLNKIPTVQDETLIKAALVIFTQKSSFKDENTLLKAAKAIVKTVDDGITHYDLSNKILLKAAKTVVESEKIKSTDKEANFKATKVISADAPKSSKKLEAFNKAAKAYAEAKDYKGPSTIDPPPGASH